MKNKKIKNIFQSSVIIPVFFLVIIFGGLFLSWLPVSAAGLVPCGNGSNYEDRCTLCHLVLGFKGIIDWGFKIFVALALLMVVVGGIMYIVSTGDQGLIGTAKGILKNTLFGFAFVLLAWLLVNFTISLLGANVGIDTAGRTWNNFTCNANSSATTTIATTTTGTTDPATTTTTVTVTAPATPTASPAGGSYATTQNVTLSVATTGASIYYTLDGTTPTSSSSKYSSSVAIDLATKTSVTLKALAIKDGTSGTVMTQTYTKTATTVAAPVFRTPGGDFASPKTVIITSASAGTIYYTDDGTVPMAQSKRFGKQIVLAVGTDNQPVSKTIKAIVIDANSNQSAVASATFNLSLKCKFIYGTENPKFLIVLKRANESELPAESPCGKENQLWDSSLDVDFQEFESAVAVLAKGIDFIATSSVRFNFGVYESPAIGVGKDATCPSATWENYGYIVKGKDGRAWAIGGMNMAAYCIDGDIAAGILAHEQLGHGFGSLDDEYVEETKKSCDYQAGSHYNCTSSSVCEKWQSLGGKCFQGCLYNGTAYYRSTDKGIMSCVDCGVASFDSVNKYVIETIANNYPNGPSVLKEKLCK